MSPEPKTFHPNARWIPILPLLLLAGGLGSTLRTSFAYESFSLFFALLIKAIDFGRQHRGAATEPYDVKVRLFCGAPVFRYQ
jgi:hypothetical protein